MTFAMIAPMLFFIVLFGAAVAGMLPYTVCAVYLCASALTFIVYAFDKAAARAGRPRTRESTLHLCGLGCGWPGALLAQKALRHKSIKQPFRKICRATVACNCGVLLLFVFPQLSLRMLALWNG
jgi:uncharacterized membrane protein YsdA (DUF1294 family)